MEGAMASSGLTVAIESVVHDSLRKMVQAIYDEHGIAVVRIDFGWLDLSTANAAKWQVTDVEAVTRSDNRRREE
jgi:hypothetical protein